MKIVIERDVLAEAVAWTARALPARPTVPVLAGIRLQAGQELTLSSFDYDVSAQATVPVTTESEGSVLVSGRLLAEISRSLPAKPVHITAEDGRAILTCGSATFTLRAPPAIAVAIGPFSATCVRRTDSTACSRGNSPTRFPPSSGAANTSHSTETPEASTICLAAFATSGPIPSPGRRVILCVIVSIILRETPQIVENPRRMVAGSFLIDLIDYC